MPDLVYTTSPTDAPTSETVTVTIDGARYTAQAPQTHVLEELSGSLSKYASPVEQAHAMISLLKDVLVDEDWIRLKTRLDDRADSLRSYAQLVPALLGICEYFGADTTSWGIGEPDDNQAPEQHQYQQPNYGRPMRTLPPARR